MKSRPVDNRQAIETLVAAYAPLRVLSLDVFDTLLVRLVPSDRVTRAVCAAIAAQLGLDVDIVYGHREAHRIEALAHGGGDFALTGWWRSLAVAHGVNPAVVARVGCEAEISTERLATRVDDEILALIDSARARGARVIATSDTWLEEAHLRELLRRHDVRVDAVFSSATECESKRRGGIFARIDAALGVRPCEVLHVGDNWKGDAMRPLGHGWFGVLRPARSGRALGWLRRDAPALSATLSVGTRQRPDPTGPTAPSEPTAHAIDATASVLAPMLAAFHVVAAARLREVGVDHVVYLARDAWAMMRVGQCLADVAPLPAPSSYLRLSRRAVSLAHPGDLLQRADGLAGKYGKSTVGDLLAAFALDDELRDRLLRSAAVDPETAASDEARDRLREAARCHGDEIASAQARQRAMIRDYVKAVCGGRVPRRLGIIDSGWAGTTQDALAAALPECERLVGLYLGVGFGGLASDARSSKEGLVWDLPSRRPPRHPLEQSAGVVRLWDLLLREPTATVLELERDPVSGVQPRLGRAPSDRDREFSEALVRGVAAVVDDLRPNIAAGVALLDPAGPGCRAVWDDALRALASELTIRPPRECAAALMAMAFDEGAVQGRDISLGLAGLGSGVAWIPGIAADLRLSRVVTALALPLRPIAWIRAEAQRRRTRAR